MQAYRNQRFPKQTVLASRQPSHHGFYNGALTRPEPPCHVNISILTWVQVKKHPPDHFEPPVLQAILFLQSGSLSLRFRCVLKGASSIYRGATYKFRSAEEDKEQEKEEKEKEEETEEEKEEVEYCHQPLSSLLGSRGRIYPWGSSLLRPLH